MKRNKMMILALMAFTVIGCHHEAKVTQVSSHYHSVEVQNNSPEALKASLCSAAQQGYKSLFYDVRLTPTSCNVPVLDAQIALNAYLRLHSKTGNYRP